MQIQAVLFSIAITLSLFAQQSAFGHNSGTTLNDCEVYLASSFPESGMWAGNASLGAYSYWASEMANDVSRWFAEGVPAAEIFDRTAHRRREFQVNQKFDGYVSADDVGAYRFSGGNLFTSLGYANTESSPSVPDNLSRQAIQVHGLQLDPAASQVLIVPINISLVSGDSFPGAELIVYPDSSVRIRHCAGYEARVIFNDALTRIQMLLTSLKPSKNEFCRAMHSYFNAMPYKRGSASIGIALFSGLYLNLFKKTVAFVPDIDVLALTNHQDMFVKNFCPRD